MRELTAAPTSVVPFTIGRDHAEAAAMEFGSPALSTNVFRLDSGSLSTQSGIISKAQSTLVVTYMSALICAL